MQLRCVRAFGNFKPGHTVDIFDDGAVFDSTYFVLDEPEPEPAEEEAPAVAKEEGK